jgi:hypothetical protein
MDRVFSRLFVAALAGVGVALVAASCGGAGGPVHVDPKLSSIQKEIFSVSCGIGSSCHASGIANPAGSLSLDTTAVSFAGLVGQPAYGLTPRRTSDGGVIEDPPGSGTYVANLCKGRVPPGAPPLRVAAGDPDHSYLVWKIAGKDATGKDLENDAQGCTPMPRTSGGALPQQHIDAIKQWIRDGALNN